jgi:hypothetical protein
MSKFSVSQHCGRVTTPGTFRRFESEPPQQFYLRACAQRSTHCVDAQRTVFFEIPFCTGEERRICRASRSDFNS